MFSTTQLIAIIVYVIVVGAVIAGVYLHNKRNAENYGDIAKIAGGRKNYLEFLYRIYSSTPILNRYFFRIKKRVEIVYPADAMSIKQKISKMLLKTTIIGILGVVFAIVTGKGDVFFIASVAVVVYVYIEKTTEGGFLKLELELLNQFADYLDAVIHYYHKRHIVELSLRSAMDQQPYEIGLHAQKIYSIINNPPKIMKEKINEYTGTEPNKFLLVFLSICSAIKINGDKKIEDGQWLFLHDIHILKDEIRSEILKKDKNQKSFRGLADFCLVVILLMKPFESFMSKNMSDMMTYYNGIYGIVSMIIIFVIAILCYQMIVVLRDNGAGKEKMREDSIWCKLASLPYISSYLSALEEKNYTKCLNINDDLRAIGDHTGAKAFLMKKYVYAIVVFFLVNIIMTSSVVAQKVQLAHNFTGSFSDSISPSAEYTITMEDTAKFYTEEVKHEKYHGISTNALADEILKNSELKNKDYATEVAQVVLQRVQQEKNTYFRWYYLLIALLVSGCAYMGPDLFLKFRGRAILQRKEDEVLQFQSLMLILMHINGTTLTDILEWTERFSYCFRQSIAECRTNMSGGKQKALEKMKADETKCQTFCHFVDNLIDIDNAGVERAFDELQSDRAFSAKSRDQNDEFSLQDRSALGNILTLVPLMSWVVIYVLIPTGMYAVSEWHTIQSFM